ncbi:MAG: hypothetical protein ACXACR_04205 [Candidatus Hodarchaeales archaeon]
MLFRVDTFNVSVSGPSTYIYLITVVYLVGYSTGCSIVLVDTLVFIN